MNFIITGALGHIGSKLIIDLPKYFPKAKFHLIDDLSSQRYSSLFNLPKNNNYNFIQGDINRINISKIIKTNSIVIHLAAITNAQESFNNKNLIEKNNYQSTKRISNLCIKKNAKLIMISTTSVYGSQSNLVDENCNIKDLRPQSPYAFVKLKEEGLLNRLSKKNNLKAVILRFGTIYGTSKGMRFHTAVNKFCFQASANQPISIWKTAYNQKRPYLDINDAIRALIFVINKKLFNGEVYNILTANHTVEEVVSKIRKYKKNIKLEFVNSKIMNQLSYEVSNTKFKKKGFIFKGDLQKSINKTLDLLKNIYY